MAKLQFYFFRHEWDTWDPMLISEGLFAAANIFSNLKLVYIFSINPHLGPLQVTLGRMVFDMMKWALLFLLVHFAFSCGEFSWDLQVGSYGGILSFTCLHAN